MSNQGTLSAPADQATQNRWYVVIMLALIYTSSQVDRQIMGILLEPIKQELGASDTAMGFLVGLTFALFYATLGMPLAMLADRSNRRNIIAISIAVWSAMTVLCGMIANFWQLALARIGVATGEAGSTPPSMSIIADLFAPEQRTTAMSIFIVGSNIGILFAFIGGGMIADNFGWRVAFFAVGAPGLLVALIFFLTVREPARRTHATDLVKDTSDEAPSFFEVWAFMFKSPALRHLTIGGVLAGFISYGSILWLPAFLTRSHGLASTEIGLILGISVGVLGAIGTLMAGPIVDRLSSRGSHIGAYAIAVTKVMIVPFTIAFFLLDDIKLALAAFVVPALLSTFAMAPSASLAQQLVGTRMRALSAAIGSFLVNLIGLGLGPQGVGMLSDLLRGAYGDDSLRYAMVAFTVVNFWCALHYWLAGRALKKAEGRL